MFGRPFDSKAMSSVAQTDDINREGMATGNEPSGALLEALGVGVLVCGRGGEIRVCNRQGRSLLGLSPTPGPDETLDHLDDRWIQADGSRLSAAAHPVRQAIATGLPVSDVVLGLLPPGAAPAAPPLAWLRLSVQPVQSAEIGHAFVCTLIDITAERQAEAQLRSQGDILQEQLDRRTLELRTFVNVLPDYICVIERDGQRYALCNDQIVSNTNAQSQQDLEGKSIYDCYPAAVADYYAEQNRHVFETGEPLHVQETIELPTKTLHLDTYKVPLKSPTGEVYALIVTARDVAELVLARQELAQRTEQLEQINRELESFSYSVSHDLRAPLRHVSGFAAALSDRLSANGCSDDPKITHYLDRIRSSSRKMGLLIDGLLDLSRVGRRSLVQRPVSLRPLVETAIALVTSHDSYNPATQFLIGDLPTVLGDATLLQQVFANLIDNAVKFSRPMSPPQIEIGCLPDHTLFVRDNGVGFPPEFADQIFGAFQRLHPEREFEGTGIGLALVQRIILRHGGTIWAESQPGQGSTFYFTLCKAQGTQAGAKLGEPEPV